MTTRKQNYNEEFEDVDEFKIAIDGIKDDIKNSDWKGKALMAYFALSCVVTFLVCCSASPLAMTLGIANMVVATRACRRRFNCFRN